MASYKDDQDAFFQEQDARKIEALKAELKRRGLGENADAFLRVLYASKVPQSQIIAGLEDLLSRSDSN